MQKNYFLPASVLMAIASQKIGCQDKLAEVLYEDHKDECPEMKPHMDAFELLLIFRNKFNKSPRW